MSVSEMTGDGFCSGRINLGARGIAQHDCAALGAAKMELAEDEQKKKALEERRISMNMA